MTKKITELSTAKPACYCCLLVDNLIEKNNGKGLRYWLCSDCQDAGFQFFDDLAQLVCPVHGIQEHLEIKNLKFVQRWAKKKKYLYDCPVHTRRTKENGLKPMFGIVVYDEVGNER